MNIKRLMVAAFAAVAGLFAEAASLTIGVAGSPGSGTVSGAGEYAAGAVVKLTAKAASGNVFAGWYLGGAPLNTPAGDYRMTTLNYVMPAAGNVALTAKFATTAEDSRSLSLASPDVTVDADGTMSRSFGEFVNSLSLPTVTLTKLPSGLKFNKKTLMFSGKAKKPGAYTAKLTLKNAAVKKARKLEVRILVPNVDSGLYVGEYAGIVDHGFDVPRYQTTVGTAGVGTFVPNAWGLYDMHGNVSEWCLDWYGTYGSAATDPAGASSSGFRILRGGSCVERSEYCSSASRGYRMPSYAYYNNGLRLAASPAVP